MSAKVSERLFSFYGDDFTGSTDALEALASSGVRAVLFLEPPGEAELARFPDVQAIGLAGESRSRDPQWMTEHLPGLFRALRAWGAPLFQYPLCQYPLFQYKVCSTFDSGPQHGSIGRALEIGREVFDSAYVPIVVAAPHLRRYVAFGNLFASGGDAICRIDRHPTMSRHPVTPMNEADLRLHLQGQTGSRISLLNLPSLLGGREAEELTAILRDAPDAVLFDGVNDLTQDVTGRLLWEHAPRPAFAIGSSGMTYALTRYWRAAGLISGEARASRVEAADRLIVVSGSCSPVTEGQIRRAMEDGYCGIRVPALSEDCVGVLRESIEVLAERKSVVLYTALGPADCREGVGGELLGRRLGSLLRQLLARSGVRRVVIAGGDTATHAVRELDIFALTFAGMTVPGAPLCRAHSASPGMDGLELVLKGGQIGPEDYFERVRRGTDG